MTIWKSLTHQATASPAAMSPKNDNRSETSVKFSKKKANFLFRKLIFIWRLSPYWWLIVLYYLIIYILDLIFLISCEEHYNFIFKKVLH